MKILIADDHELFLKGLEFILQENIKNIQITTANSYTEIFQQLNQNDYFDLIITDLAMPGANWLTAITKIHEILPETPIIIISAVFDKEILKQTLDIGVAGYIPKTASNNLIISAINLVLAGGVYIPHELLYTAKNATSSNEKQNDYITPLKNLEKISLTPQKSPEKRLTERQIDIVKCIAEGLSNKQIAYKLNLTEGTVKVHITVILKVLNVKNRTSAVIEAAKRGYITNNNNN
ncbi:MAG: response regulator transcription factor [Alphaproteobacteria bacterium]|nr:response regulator transcription factor [Alphaproteobacteria bacterium]MBP3687409.1 response regulator transcription factor [Alphaproteobacteria bacterium]